MYLIYLDDGGKADIKIFGGVIIEHQLFRHLEMRCAFLMRQLKPGLSEFHASDLFKGVGEFEDVSEEARFDAIRNLLHFRGGLGIPYIYSAVDVPALQRSVTKSASWLDVAFHMCVCSIDEWLWSGHMKALGIITDRLESNREFSMPEMPVSLMVVDDPEQGERDKGKLRRTFRDMRLPLSNAMEPMADSNQFIITNRLRVPVDDMYFGSSADSIGLQIADLCNWIMWRHLSGNDPGQGFYDLLVGGKTMCAKPEPEWSRNRYLLKAHDE